MDRLLQVPITYHCYTLFILPLILNEHFLNTLVEAAGQSRVECGTTDPLPKMTNGQQRIVGGVEAEPHSLPWLVSIQRSGEHSCGGTLISCPKQDKPIVVTAAHCFYRRFDYEVRVKFGVHHLYREKEEGVVTAYLKEVISHKNYDDPSSLNDIAMFSVSFGDENKTRSFRFTDRIRPICLPKAGQIFKHGTPATVAGWGRIQEYGRRADELLKADVKIIHARICNQTQYKINGSVYYDEMLCAGHREGQKDACEGDSGGPLMIRHRKTGRYLLAGIVSFGEGCAAPYSPGVYTKIAHFVPWIGKNLDILCENSSKNGS